MFQGQNISEVDVGGLLGLLTARWNGTEVKFPEPPTGVHLKTRTSEHCCNGCHSEDWCAFPAKVSASEHCCNGCHSEDWCAIPSVSHVK